MAQDRQARRWLFARGRSAAAFLYAPLVLGVTTFVASLVCCRTVPPEYAAEAVVIADAGETDGQGAALEQWLTSEEVLRAALVNTNWPKLTSGREALDAAQRLAELQQRVHVVALHQPDESPRIAIRCEATRGASALALAGELARQVAEHFERQCRDQSLEQQEQQREQIRGRLRVVLEEEERQRGEVDRLRHGQLAMALSRPGERLAASAIGSEPLNPRWVELKKQLEALQSQRQEMLEVLQDSHPEITGINLRIAKLTGSLDKTPRQLSPSITPISHGKPLLEWRRPAPSIAQQQYQEESRAETRREGLDPVLTLAAQLDEATHQLAVVTNQRKALEWDQGRLDESEAALRESPFPSWQPQPAQLSPRLSGGYTRGQSRLASMLGMSVAGVAALWQIVQRRRQLNTPADVLVQVHLPLVAILDVPAASTSSPGRLTALRLLTRNGEALILGIGLTCLAAAWFDPGLAAEYRLDPIAALAETARRIF